MGILDTIAILISCTAALAYINHRFLKMPMTIGLMLLAMLCSIMLLIFGHLVPGYDDYFRTFLGGIDFNETLMGGMLSFLLFAGALHVNLNDLREQMSVILILATIGVVLSTFLVGSIIFYMAGLFGYELQFLHALLF